MSRVREGKKPEVRNPDIWKFPDNRNRTWCPVEPYLHRTIHNQSIVSSLWKVIPCHFFIYFDDISISISAISNIHYQPILLNSLFSLEIVGLSFSLKFSDFDDIFIIIFVISNLPLSYFQLLPSEGKMTNLWFLQLTLEISMHWNVCQNSCREVSLTVKIGKTVQLQP